MAVRSYLLLCVEDEPEACMTIQSRFFDLNHRCSHWVPVDAQEAYQTAYSKQFDTHTAPGCTVIFVRPDAERFHIIGWYEQATLYFYTQVKKKAALYYHIACASDAVWYFEGKGPCVEGVTISSRVTFLRTKDAQRIEKTLREHKALAKSAWFDFEALTTESFVGEAEPEEVQADRIKRYEEAGDVSLLPAVFRAAKHRCSFEASNAHSYDELGFAYLQFAHPEEALVCFEKALVINPELVSSVLDKGECLNRLGREKEAIAWFNANLHIDNADLIRFHLAATYEMLGFQAQAYRIFKSIKDPEKIAETQAIISEIEAAMPFLRSTDEAPGQLDVYHVFLGIQEKTLPETFSDVQGIKRYIDPIRKKSVILTPEETVRQQVIAFSLEDLHVPPGRIKVEESLTHIDREFRARVDILVQEIDTGRVRHVFLIECKAPGIPLEGEPMEQMQRYNHVLMAPFVMLTDGDSSLLYHFDQTKGVHTPLRELPQYNDMLRELNIKPAALPNISWKRPAFENLSKPGTLSAYRNEWIIGEDTPVSRAPFFINLAACLLDDTHCVTSPHKVPGCTIVTDYGIKSMFLGNAGGGGYHGNYRWLGVEDRAGNRHNVYFKISSSGRNPDEVATGKNKWLTYLLCGIEEKGKSVSRLQINLDACTREEGDRVRFTHTGARSRGKIQPLIDYTSQAVPELLGKKDRFDLGALRADRNLYLSEPDVADVIGNIASYLLLRCELRQLEREGKADAGKDNRQKAMAMKNTIQDNTRKQGG